MKANTRPRNNESSSSSGIANGAFLRSQFIPGGGSSLREGSILEDETKPAREANPSVREGSSIDSSPEDRLPFESPPRKEEREGEQTLVLS